MRAVILAGGKGVRLRPYSTILPKPLMPIGDMSILEVIIRQLKGYGFNHITLAVGYLCEIIEAFFRDGRKYGIKIDYSFEDKPLGTAGPIMLIKDLSNPFLVMNGDLLTTINYKKLIEFHKENKCTATVATSLREVAIDFGVVKMGEDSNLTDIVEKPSYFFDVSMGINVFNLEVKEYINKDTKMDIPELILRLKEKGKKVLCYRTDCYWLDIGKMEDYQKGIDEFEQKKDMFLKGC